MIIFFIIIHIVFNTMIIIKYTNQKIERNNLSIFKKYVVEEKFNNNLNMNKN